MTVVNLLLNLKAMLEREFKENEIKGKNKDIEKKLLKEDATINIDKSIYCYPNVYIGYRPVTTNQYDYPAVIIVPPMKAKESQQEREYDITFILSIKHNIKAVDSNAVLEAVSFVERMKDILFKNRLLGGFALNIESVEWGVDVLMSAADISIAEINVNYNSINNYE